MTDPISRRDFLKVGGAALFGLAFSPIPPGEGGLLRHKPGYRLGRTATWLIYYDRPSTSGRDLGFYNTDTVVHIYEEALGDPYPVHNPVWLRTDDGWIHSSYVQPVRRVLNKPVEEIPPGGFLGEVTVPYTTAYTYNEKGEWKRAYRFYYSSTHWVIHSGRDDWGQVWYRIVDDLDRDRSYYVIAEHLRQVPASELAPISPNTTGKHIEVDLDAQKLRAFLNGQLAREVVISTGLLADSTPRGEFSVERKLPSRHMASMPGDKNPYDLPGVPWVCFISWTGVSLHGTYWHNNYGQPQSHGCINLKPEDAKWIYRWTEPVVPPDDNFVKSDYGTSVSVI